MNKEIRKKIREAGWEVNRLGFVIFKNRNMSWKGDRSSYVKITRKWTRIIRGEGEMSPAYNKELQDFEDKIKEWLI